MDIQQCKQINPAPMRKCIEILVHGLRLRGTVHVPPDEATKRTTGFEGLGVIVLHPGFLPRSGQGQLAVALSDALAEMGITTVRMDQPGLGDSEGDLPVDSVSFVKTVQEGGFAELTCECLDRVKEELGLQRLVIGGHCGGAITAFYAATSRPTNWPEGIFALDLIFTLALENSSSPGNSPTLPAREGWRLRFTSFRDEIRAALLKTGMGDFLQKSAQKTRRFISNTRSSLPHPAQRNTVPTELPPQTNDELLNRVKQALKSQTRLLFIAAVDPRKDTEFDYLDYLLSDGPLRAQYKKVSGTDHGFLAGDGKLKVIEHVRNWFENEFRKSSVAE
ncbi:MAG: alpha/beta fold hydrolase [bacterium]